MVYITAILGTLRWPLKLLSGWGTRSGRSRFKFAGGRGISDTSPAVYRYDVEWNALACFKTQIQLHCRHCRMAVSIKISIFGIFSKGQWSKSKFWERSLILQVINSINSKQYKRKWRLQSFSEGEAFFFQVSRLEGNFLSLYIWTDTYAYKCNLTFFLSGLLLLKYSWENVMAQNDPWANEKY